MNSKKKTIILIALFVILMVGASVLYNNLSKTYEPNTLLTEDNNADVDFDNTTANPTNSDTESAKITAQEEISSSETQNLAPNFTVYDLEGNEINLTDFFGKPIIINFWASWCGPCKMEMPDFNEAYESYKDDLTFLMVNMTDGSRETKELASSFIAESGYTFPVYYDTGYSAAITYSVSSLPTSYFINAEGELVTYARGAINAATLQKGIDMIYNNEQ